MVTSLELHYMVTSLELHYRNPELYLTYMLNTLLVTSLTKYTLQCIYCRKNTQQNHKQHLQRNHLGLLALFFVCVGQLIYKFNCL